MRCLVMFIRIKTSSKEDYIFFFNSTILFLSTAYKNNVL